MRTTIELSDPLYRRMRAVAAARGERGFSPIVETAVREYLDREAHPDAGDDAFAAARGAWSPSDEASFEAEPSGAGNPWQSPRA